MNYQRDEHIILYSNNKDFIRFQMLYYNILYLELL